jgi:hypothetical protein
MIIDYILGPDVDYLVDQWRVRKIIRENKIEMTDIIQTLQLLTRYHESKRL